MTGPTMGREPPMGSGHATTSGLFMSPTQQSLTLVAWPTSNLLAEKIMKQKPVPSLLIALCASVFLGGCATVGTPKVGAPCKVQFRRDALGGSSNLPIGPMVDRSDGATVSLNAKYKAMSKDWIVVQDESGDIWIPCSTILLFKVFRE